MFHHRRWLAAKVTSFNDLLEDKKVEPVPYPKSTPAPSSSYIYETPRPTTRPRDRSPPSSWQAGEPGAEAEAKTKVDPVASRTQGNLGGDAPASTQVSDYAPEARAEVMQRREIPFPQGFDGVQEKSRPTRSPTARRSLSQPQPAPSLGLSRAERTASVPPAPGVTDNNFVTNVPDSSEPMTFTDLSAVINPMMVIGWPQRRQQYKPRYRSADGEDLLCGPGTGPERQVANYCFYNKTLLRSDQEQIMPEPRVVMSTNGAIMYDWTDRPNRPPNVFEVPDQ